MRRIIKLLFLTFLFPIIGNSQTIAGGVVIDEWVPIFDRTFAVNSKEVIKGRVKSTTEHVYHAKEKFGDVIKEDLRGHEISYFNRNGKILKSKFIYEREMFSESTLCKGEYVMGDSHRSYTLLFSYNNFGMLSEINQYEDSTLSRKIKFKLNLTGNPVEKNEYCRTGDLESKREYKYDKNNNIISVINYDDYKNKKDVMFCTYNDKNLIRSDTWDKDNKEIISSYIYIYNDKNQIVTRVCVSPIEDTYELKKYIYDSNENIITILYFENKFYYSKTNVVNKVDSERIYYNANGNVINHNVYKLGNYKKPELFYSNKDEFKYIYDKYGNWISRTFYRADNPEQIIERKIEYYE